MADHCVYVRFAGESPLHCATVAADLPIGEQEVVVVHDAKNARRLASVVGQCEHLAGREPAMLRIVESYNIDPASPLKLAEVVSMDVIDAVPAPGHRWGGPGLPAGSETHVSPAHEPMKPDAWYATQSEGYRETIANRVHRLVPGDKCRVFGKDVMVNAINRRENAIELLNLNDQSISSMPIDEFIEKEERA